MFRIQKIENIGISKILEYMISLSYNQGDVYRFIRAS